MRRTTHPFNTQSKNENVVFNRNSLDTNQAAFIFQSEASKQDAYEKSSNAIKHELNPIESHRYQISTFVLAKQIHLKCLSRKQSI